MPIQPCGFVLIAPNFVLPFALFPLLLGFDAVIEPLLAAEMAVLTVKKPLLV